MLARVLFVVAFAALPSAVLADCSTDPRAAELRLSCGDMDLDEARCEAHVQRVLGPNCERPDAPVYTNPEIEECPADPQAALQQCINEGGNPDACQERLDLAVELCPTEPGDPIEEPVDPRMPSCPITLEEAFMYCMDQIGEEDRCTSLAEEAAKAC